MPDSSRDQALAALVRDRGEALTRYAYLFTGDTASAQDLLQDALVKVFVRSRSGFEAQALEAYVRRTIATLYIDGYRKRRTFAGVQHLLVDPEANAGPDVGTADRLDLHQALATLSRQERAVVVLRFFEDLTVADVAAAMGLAEGSVKRYLSNAVRKLETRLGPIAGTDTDEDGSVVVLDQTRRGRS